MEADNMAMRARVFDDWTDLMLGQNQYDRLLVMVRDGKLYFDKL